jgi:hypothetical protein
MSAFQRFRGCGGAERALIGSEHQHLTPAHTFVILP